MGRVQLGDACGGIIIFQMKIRAVFIVIGFLVFVAGVMVLYSWTFRPQIIEILPAADTDNVSATEPIQLKFSRGMDHDSINSRLVIEPVTQGAISWEGNTLVFIPSAPWPRGKVITVRLEAGGRASSWLVFPLGDVRWSFSTRTSALAYLWPANGSASIYSLDPITGSVRQYTKGISVLDYSTNHDGSLFYFSGSNQEGGADLFRIDRIKADSSQGAPYQADKILDCRAAQCRNPVVSPDGRTLAYEYVQPTSGGGLGLVQVWTLSLSTRKTEPVGETSHRTDQPAWSSSGLLAYYDWTSSGYEVFNPATQARTLLANQTGRLGSWSPDGEYYLAPEISYQQATQGYETGNSHLLRYHIQDKGIDDLSGEGAVEDVEAAYSPDGSLIAFTRKFLDPIHWSLGRQLWIMGSDGSNPHNITNSPNYNHYDLAWNQDGSMLAYVRFNQEMISNPPELWMIDVDGSDPVQLVIGGYSPTWIP